MKSKLLLLFTFFIFFDGFGQIGFEEHVVIDNTSGVLGIRDIFASDIDGDGDLDMITASYDDDKIAWYENIDGQGKFDVQKIISTNANGALSVFSSDIDGDGDMDVLSASIIDDKIAWYENVDGQGEFGMEVIIAINEDGANSVVVADIDGDGDMDVLSTSQFDSKVAWYENVDGEGDFGDQQIISSNLDGVASINIQDIDGDGDLDVLASSLNGDKIVWYENIDGIGSSWLEQIISTELNWPRKLHAADLDNDGDIDVLAASSLDDKFVWFENTNGQGDFGIQQLISDDLNPLTIHVVDIDQDGDIDIFSSFSFSFDDKIVWYENDGLGNFSSENLITEEITDPTTISSADVNGDGKLDIVSTSFTQDKVIWYENIDGLGNFGNLLFC
jgi:hypothetical protein